jgi:hypothetical protein
MRKQEEFLCPTLSSGYVFVHVVHMEIVGLQFYSHALHVRVKGRGSIRMCRV